MWPRFKTTLLLFLGICLFRILNTFLIQSFFDPDEYWQTLEPAYCEVFLKSENATNIQDKQQSASLNLGCPGYTWEWKRRAKNTTTFWIQQSLEGPIRSYLSVLPTHLFYSMLYKLHWDSHFLVSQGPKILTAVIAAAPTDLAVWIMGHWMIPLAPKGSDQKEDSQQSLRHNLPWFCLFCSTASWFHGYALVRTFSNSLETMLLSISMVLVAPELLGNASQQSISARTTRHCICFLLGGCSVAMRLSSVAAWVPMGILLANGAGTGEAFWKHWLLFLLGKCALFGVLGIAIACAVDRHFYGFWTVPFLGSFHFNVMLGNSALYGSHPWHWYLTAGIPVVTGLWLPLVLYDLCIFLTQKREDSKSPARRNLWIVILCFTIAHSQSGHKEFRFLMPILPLFCLLAGPHVMSFLQMCRHRGNTERQRPLDSNQFDIFPWLFLMAVPNMIALLYLGLFHQSAPISVNHKIASLAALSLGKQSSGDAQSMTFSIHYLTGACHSTPLHSYLHVPGPVHFDTWSLDCSPDCRSNPNITCESERFAQDPISFVEAAYFESRDCPSPIDSDDQEEDTGDHTCSAFGAGKPKAPPDFFVTYADYAKKLRPQLSALDLVEVSRFSYGINGLKLGNLIATGDGYPDGVSVLNLGPATHRRIRVLGNYLELSIDEMVLYASPICYTDLG